MRTTTKEIYNYLNLVDRRLGLLYKLTGYNPLPPNFSFDSETIMERLYLNQMPSSMSFPDFLYEDKKDLKKRFAMTLKRIKQILKEEKYKACMSKEFAGKFENYLIMRREVTSLILKDFGKTTFDECNAYIEICSINTIFFDLLEQIFDDEFNFSVILPTLEELYNIYYSERLKRLEEKRNNQISKNNQKIAENVAISQKNQIKLEKISEKNNKLKQISDFKQEKNRKNREKA